jgi:hypothetical protein
MEKEISGYCWPWIASICTWPPIWLAKLPCSGLAQLHQVIFSRIQLIMWVSDSEVFSFFYRDFKLSASQKSCSILCRGHCIMFGWRPLSCEHLLPCNTLNSSKPGRPTSCTPYYPHMLHICRTGKLWRKSTQVHWLESWWHWKPQSWEFLSLGELRYVLTSL